MNFFHSFLFLCLVLTACGPEARFKKAEKLEKTGKNYQAWQTYQEFSAKYPNHPSAPAATFHAGWLAQRHLNDCSMAGVFYDSVLSKYPQSDPWARLALNQKINCPDYFPLLPGAQWVEGDSETKGKNARIETDCKPAPEKGSLPSEAGQLVRTYFAGKSKFRTITLIYKKAGEEVQEFSAEYALRPKTILKLPPVAGARWKTRSADRLFTYEIAEVGVTVKVEAGEFPSCVMVKSSVEAIPGATHEYYAPGVGRILTAFATPQGEKRNTELLSYKPAPQIDFKELAVQP